MKTTSKLIFFLILSYYCTFSIVYAQPSAASIEKIKKAIVTINTRVATAAYKNSGNWSGTGFIADKQNGLVVTNNHVVGRASIGNYTITFYDGRQAEGKLLYYDLWQDYAILKINKQDIPNSIEQIIFSKNLATANQNVFVVGNTEGQDFSFHTGYISNLYDITGEMPQSSYVINLNSIGGASGSPVLNNQDEAIGVLYGGGKTYVLALHGSYVQYALDAIKNNQIPIRKHCGIITEPYSLDKAVKHRNFPKKEMEGYLNKFPNARNRGISVRNIINGSGAEGILQAGDIIWAINDKELEGNLTILDNAMNLSTENAAKLTIYRDGQRLEKLVPLYDVNKNKIEIMVDFAGATIFASDDYASANTGVGLGQVSIANVATGSSFSVIPTNITQGDKSYYRFVLNSIAGYNIKTIDELIKNIPAITKHKFVNIKFKNYQPYFSAFQSAENNSFITTHEDLMYDITLDAIDTKPRILRYNHDTLEWTANDINM